MIYITEQTMNYTTDVVFDDDEKELFYLYITIEGD